MYTVEYQITIWKTVLEETYNTMFNGYFVLEHPFAVEVLADDFEDHDRVIVALYLRVRWFR
jgi:hypothetical protein